MMKSTSKIGCLLIMAAICVLSVNRAHSSEQPVDSRGLEAALQATLDRHPALSGKQAEVDAKGYASFSARAQRYPSLSGQMGYFEHEDKQTTLRAQQPLWAFGKIDNDIAYADTDKLVEEADQLRVKRQLLEKTAIAYAQLYGVYQRQKVAAENIVNHEELFNKIVRRQRGQLASETDVLLAKARLVQSQIQKERIDGELRSAQSELRSYTQVAIGADLPVPQRFVQLPDEDEIESLALARNADVQYKTEQITLARARLDQERVAPLPTLSMQAVYNNNDALQNQEETTLSVVLEGGLSGLGMVNLGRQKAANAQLEAARQDLQVVRNDLTQQVSILVSNRHMESSLVEIQRESVVSLSATLESYQRQYEAGRKAWLDVLNIQRELTEQRLQEVQAANEWLIYSLKLKSLLGDLDLT